MSKRYYTVVYEIHNDEAFKRVASAASGSMDTGTGPIDGVRVTACGEGDAMSQADALNEFALEIGHDPDEIVREWAENNDLDGDEILG
jgi:hypothetical protein